MRAFINVNRKRAETVKGKPAVLQVQYPPHHFGERESWQS